VLTVFDVGRALTVRAWVDGPRAGADVDLRVAAAVLLWLPLIFALDRGATLSTQRPFGVATLVLCLGVGTAGTARCSRLDRSRGAPDPEVRQLASSRRDPDQTH
jgi:hypothetical protein